MRLIRLLTTAACTAAVLGGAATAAQAACTETWTGAAGNAWSNPSNWSPQAVPGAATTSSTVGCDVVLPANGAHYPVDLSFYSLPNLSDGTNTNDSVIGNLTIAGGAGLVVHGQSYVIRGDGYQTIGLTVNGSGSIAQGGSLELLTSDDGPVTPEQGHGGAATLDGSGTITNAGSLTSVSTSGQATLANATFHNQLNSSVVNSAGANATVGSGYLDVNAENTVTNQGTWTVAAGARMALQYNGFNQHGTATSFTNDGSYVNAGATVMNQHDHAQVGNSFDNPITWHQAGGSVTGNPIALVDGAKLDDAAGTGSFEFNQYEGQISGTIPAGQTVTVEGDPNGNGYTTEVTLDGSSVLNAGTFVVHVPNVSTDANTDVRLHGATLVNQGTFALADEAPKLISEIQVPVTNRHGGTIAVQSGTTWFTAGQAVTNDGTLTISPGAGAIVNANPFLTGPSTFTNAGDGTIVPQLAAGATGTLTFGHDANVTLGGTVSPQLVGGYVPAVGTEVQAFPIDPARVTIAGQFAAIGGGFTADYSHETTGSPNYIGLVYGGQATSGGGGGTHGARSPVTVRRPRVRRGKLVVALSCPAGSHCAPARITVTVTEKLRAGRRGKTRTKRIVVGRRTVSLRAGTHRSVTVGLNAGGRRLLARRHRLRVTVAVASGTRRHSYAVTLRAAKQATHRKHHRG